MTQTSSILNSELAVRVLSAIASRTDGDYCTNLADELDKSQPSISRVLTKLYEISFIEKGPREKVQYYRIDYEEITDYWYLELEKKLKEKEKQNSLKNFNKNGEQIKELAQNFFQEFLKTSPSDITLSRLLFEGFAYSIGSSIIEDHKVLKKNDFLDPTLEALKIYTSEEEFCNGLCRAMNESVEETLN